MRVVLTTVARGYQAVTKRRSVRYQAKKTLMGPPVLTVWVLEMFERQVTSDTNFSTIHEDLHDAHTGFEVWNTKEFHSA